MAKKVASQPVPSGVLLRRGANLRKRREALGWSQAELAAKAGTTQQTVDRIERGQTEFSRALPDIAHALGVQLRVNTREIYEEIPWSDLPSTTKPSIEPDNSKTLTANLKDTQLVPLVINSLEQSVRFAISEKFPEISSEAAIALFSNQGSVLDLAALAFFAEVSGVASKRERNIILAAARLRDVMADPQADWTSAADSEAISLARQVVELYLGPQRDDDTAVWAKCGMVLLGLNMKFRFGAEEAATLMRGEADFLFREED